jgi:hypothetical protein
VTGARLTDAEREALRKARRTAAGMLLAALDGA